MKKLTGVQYLRGIAALLVVLDHVRGMAALPRYSNSGSDPWPWLGLGAIGVDIFFVISGFIIVVACFRQQTLQPKIDVRGFLLHRFARIVPFLWFCVATYAAVRWLGAGKFEWPPYLRAVTLWPLGEVRPNVVWTLRHEALFYLIFALAMLWARRPAILALWCVSPILYHFSAYGNELSDFLFNPVNLEFGAGATVGLAFLKYPHLFRRTTSHTFMFLMLLCAGMLAVAVFLELGERTVANAVLLALMASVIVVIAALDTNDPPALSRIGVLLGDASYSIYLVHGLMVLVCLELIRLIGPGMNLFVVYSLTVMAGTVGGVFIHLAIERPVVKFWQRVLGIERPVAKRSESLTSVSR